MDGQRIRKKKIDGETWSQSSENYEIDWDSRNSLGVKNSQSSSKTMSKRKKHLRHFSHLDQEEVLKRYSCALASDFLRQGYLYVTYNYFAFYSNIFGYVTKLLIPIVSVEEITKEKTAKIIPNAIGIVIGKDRHVFSSFIKRDSSYLYLRNTWQGVKGDVGPISDFDSDSISSLEEEEEPTDNDDLQHEDNKATFTDKIDTTTTTNTKKPLSNLVWYSTIIIITILVLMSGILLYKVLKIQSKSASIPTTPHFDKNLFQDSLAKSYLPINEFIDKNKNIISGIRKSLETLYKVLEADQSVKSTNQNNI